MFTTGFAFTWYETVYPVAPLTAAQLNITEEEVETPQFIVALNMGLTVIVNVVVVAH